MPSCAFRRVLVGLVVLLAYGRAAEAQSRAAVLDATGISILDTSTGQQQARFTLTLQPGETVTGLTAAADGLSLYVTTSLPQSQAALQVIDAVTGQRTAYFGLPPYTSGKAVVTPGGDQAFLLTSAPGSPNPVVKIVWVDLTGRFGSLTLHEAREDGMCSGLTLSPDGGTLYFRCNRFLPPSGSAGLLAAYSIGPGRASRAWTDSSFPSSINGLGRTADGSRLYATWEWQGLSPRIHAYDAATHAHTTHSLSGKFPGAFTLGSVAAQSATRLFGRVAIFVTDHYEDNTYVFDTSTNSVLATAAGGGEFVSDPYQGRTFTLESTRFSLLNDDTAVATTVATGVGWLDAIVLKDPCPSAATISPSLFTTNEAAGTLTIIAAGSCSWTIDPSTVPGLAFTTLSGTGSASLPFTLARRGYASRDTFKVNTRTLTVERLHPQMNIDEPGAVAQQPFIVRGWAIETSVAFAPPIVFPTVSTVHVWAWPMPSGAPIFVGAGPASGPRPDISAAFGGEYGLAEFSVPVRGLPTGTYLIGVYAYSARLGAFTQQQGVTVSVLPGTRVAIEEPGPSVPRTFTVSGWAVDASAVTGPGIDAVHVWAFPESGAAPVWVGAADYGSPRDDVAATYGPSFRYAGYRLYGSLPPGRYTLQVFARSTVSGEFSAATAPLTVVADSAPAMNIDEPASSSTITGTFQVRGWAIDRGAATGTGIDAFHIWAFPTDGSAARFVGVGSPTTRPDIAAIAGPQFAESGFLLTGASLPAGAYTLAVFGRSTVTSSFSVIRVVTITVQ